MSCYTYLFVLFCDACSAGHMQQQRSGRHGVGVARVGKTMSCYITNLFCGVSFILLVALATGNTDA
jgi:hypothetical protein